jgi:molybdopterin-biosynthesis enzyme MoeA-like protein
MSSPADARPGSFGLIVIGDEILNGNRTDKHLPVFRAMLGERGHGLAWCWILPDDPALLTRQLAASMDAELPVFCCGGIGATPDDHTRACAAVAAGVELVRHPAALALIEDRFGAEAHPHRVLMADLPAGATLIPNPVNQIPGFALHGHWFLPGFPRMAWPMAEWVLDRHYPPSTPTAEAAVAVWQTPESHLIPLMQRLDGVCPGLKLFSLPHLGEDPADRYVLLGFRGHGDLDAAMAALRAALDAAGLVHGPPPTATAD